MIYFVRHGQTDDNIRENILTGWNDIPINATGFKQAEETALQLKDINFDICFCSPLLRARQTLDEIIKYHKDLKVVFDDRLKERDCGELTGMPDKVCTFRRWNANDKIPPSMESIPALFKRVENFYKDIKKEYKNKTILIVSHSGTARMSYFYFHGKPKDNDYSNFKLNNAEVLKLEWQK